MYQRDLSCDDVQCMEQTNKMASKHGQESNHCSFATHAPNCQTDGQMDGVRERIKVPPAVSNGVLAEIENEVFGELQSNRNVLLKDRIKSFTQSIYEHCKEKL